MNKKKKDKVKYLIVKKKTFSPSGKGTLKVRDTKANRKKYEDLIIEEIEEDRKYWQ